jgi:hypothetical protein
MTEKEFRERWAKEFAEWQAIGDEMILAGKQPSAFDVTQEQRRRMKERGDISVFADPEVRKLFGWSSDAN